MSNKEVSISRVDNRSFLNIGKENIEIADYGTKSSADGTTELLITIKGTASIFELSTNLEVQKL